MASSRPRLSRPGCRRYRPRRRSYIPCTCTARSALSAGPLCRIPHTSRCPSREENRKSKLGHHRFRSHLTRAGWRAHQPCKSRTACTCTLNSASLLIARCKRARMLHGQGPQSSKRSGSPCHRLGRSDSLCTRRSRNGSRCNPRCTRADTPRRANHPRGKMSSCKNRSCGTYTMHNDPAST